MGNLKEKYNLPSSVRVFIKKSKKGFYAKFPDYPGCFTVAENGFELIKNITDALLTYFEVPRKDAIKSNIYYLPPQAKMDSLENISEKSASSKTTELNADFLYFAALKNSYGSSNSRIR